MSAVAGRKPCPWELTQARDYAGGPKRWQLSVTLDDIGDAGAIRAARGWRFMDVTRPAAGEARYQVSGIPVSNEEMLAIASGADPLAVVLHGWRHLASRPYGWLTARSLTVAEMMGNHREMMAP